jgi:hypothetical protein
MGGETPGAAVLHTLDEIWLVGGRICAKASFADMVLIPVAPIVAMMTKATKIVLFMVSELPIALINGTEDHSVDSFGTDIHIFWIDPFSAFYAMTAIIIVGR